MIYYVEDDENIRELVVYTLGQTGLPARGFADGAAFWTALGERLPSLILLDIMLPGEDGLAILKKLRGELRTSSIPVMMITARGAEYDKVSGLDLGADDYLAKPFGMAELVARVKALLRRASADASAAETLALGGLRVDQKRHAVHADGREITLTLKEFSLLTRLMERPGQVFSREQLLATVWGYEYEGGTRTVDVHIQTLRSKLGRCGEMIQTVRGVGYRLGDTIG